MLKESIVDKIRQRIILRKVHNNVQIIPSELVPYDFLTDSLQHQASVHPPVNEPFKTVDGSAVAIVEFQRTVKALFGFPYSLPLAQGRMTEALLARLLIGSGSVIPTNIPFATTRLHQEISGGVSIEVLTPEAYNFQNDYPYKGNIDLEALEQVIDHYTPRWIPFISIELSANGVGGQPVSMENLKAVSQIARKHGIKIVLDACRIMENAYQIQRLDDKYEGKAVDKIVKEMASYADIVSMSLTKGFPTTIGGLVAFKDEALYQESFDFVMAMGDGLDHAAKWKMIHALKSAMADTGYVEQRMHVVEKLFSAMERIGFPVLQPCGGHAVLVDVDRLMPHLAGSDLPGEALNLSLYRTLGMRGAPHLMSSQQQERGQRLFRFAVPINTYTEADIDVLIPLLTQWFEKRGQVKALIKEYVPKGLSGDFRAWFKTA